MLENLDGQCSLNVDNESIKFSLSLTEKRKIIKIVKKRRDSSTSAISLVSRRCSTLDMDGDENIEGGGSCDDGSLTRLKTETDSLQNYLLNKNDEKVAQHVATLAKLAKPSDYKPPKAQPVELDGLNYIVHRLPNRKRHTSFF